MDELQQEIEVAEKRKLKIWLKKEKSVLNMLKLPVH